MKGFPEVIWRKEEEEASFQDFSNQLFFETFSFFFKSFNTLSLCLSPSFFCFCLCFLSPLLALSLFLSICVYSIPFHFSLSFLSTKVCNYNYKKCGFPWLLQIVNRSQMGKLYSGPKDRVYGVTFGPVASCLLKFVLFPVFVKRTYFSNLLCVGVPKRRKKKKRTRTELS